MPLVAAAAKHDSERYEDNPGAVIVKEMAKAIVVHKRFLPGDVVLRFVPA